MTLKLQTVISTAASVAATAMLLRSLTRDYLPHDLHHYLHSKLSKILTALSSEITLVINEFEALTNNHLFHAALLYLKPHTTPNTKRFRATMPAKSSHISLLIDRNNEISDTFNGVQFNWKLVSEQIPSKYIQSDDYHSTLRSEVRFFELRFHKKHKEMVLREYLQHVMEKAKEAREKRKTLKLFTLRDRRMGGRRREMWQGVNLDHPATFETLAMDSDMKSMIMEDLDRFVERRGLYRSVGKAWKRGYLLSGPPGTGKSSLIAAMANYLNFDVYDLELTDVKRNSELRKLLIATANRSILVVEDIDCSLELHDRLKPKPVITLTATTMPHHLFDDQKPQVTLSGFLNFVDGLWSSCGDERIIVFTTNHKEKLDPALLRPGRMDVHIDMTYCTPCGFKMLASNYLGITQHPLFDEVDKLLGTTNVTPAEVGEQFLKYEDPEIAVKSLLHLLIEKGN
ncbi:protein HYPER-SENSITIVITY-RELATED 4-like [Abrus precatorius]|uniref:Protein HYPER-SENSITIVITY-RELATED 4-like n=1 Tax=Abrus precatorius TaxID=3816 RepID=A0A8B8LM71_ABRPR|nr:protein HYPER-SENSITIVITY-RELATED 4-like [Abrus precatorius]